MAESATLRQSSFSGGVLSPQLLGRVDLQKYQSGFAVLRNFLVVRNGAIENRPGSVYVSRVKSSANPVRLVKFGLTTDQELLLELGNLYMRFYLNGAPVGLVPPGTLPWNNAIAYQTGNFVSYSSAIYVALLSNTNVTPSPTANATWQLVNQNPWNSGQIYQPGMTVLYGSATYLCIATSTNNAPPNATYWYPQPNINSILELPTNIPQAALATLQVAQIQDQLFIASQLFAPLQLVHQNIVNWSIGAFTPSNGVGVPQSVTLSPGVPAPGPIAAPTGFGASGGSGGSATYTITAISNTTPQVESAGLSGTGQVATSGSPVTLTWTHTPGSLASLIYLSGYLIGIAATGINSFVDAGVPPITNIRPYPAAPIGDQALYNYVVTAVAEDTGIEGYQSANVELVTGVPTQANPNVIAWTAVNGASSYNVYSYVNGIPGFIGSSSTPTFSDTNITPNTAKQPPVAIPLFNTVNDYPAVVASQQSRLFFANTLNQPQSVWGSNVAAYYNFTNSLPVLDGNAFTFTITGNERQFVNGIVDIGRMVIITSAGEYVALGNAYNEVTPSADGTQRNGTSGGALVPGIAIGTTALYVDSAANIIRDLRYSIYTTTYTGKDTTLYAPQLFENNQIVQIDWQKVYNSIVWCVQTSGAFLGMTYIIDQDMWAWHAHDFYLGVVEQVCCVREGPAVTVYLVVNRTINGSTLRSIERLANREFTDYQFLSDAIFTDSSLTYDGRNTVAFNTVTATTSSSPPVAWTTNDVITLTGNVVGAFTPLAVGNAICLREIANGTQLMPIDPDTANDNTIPVPYPIGWVIDQVVFTILTINSNSDVVTCTASKNVPTWAQNVAITTYGLMANVFPGMNQAIGQAITIQGDGAVVANALTDAVPTVVQSDGHFTTTDNYLVLTAGFPIIGQVQTLPRDSGGRTETLMNKEQLMVEVAVMFYNTRGGYWGPDFQHLYEWDQRGLQFEPMGLAPILFTGRALIPLAGAWQDSGQVCLQQTDPLPMSISAIAPTGYSASDRG
jgi:hypothetical protein